MFRFAAICLLSAACANDSSTGIDTAALTCPPDSTLTYGTYGQVTIEENCLSCHAGKENPRLVTVEEIRANKAAIMREAVASTNMPDSSGMLLEERELLGEWLACGAP
jgi:uncharacterized membrane protein